MGAPRKSYGDIHVHLRIGAPSNPNERRRGDLSDLEWVEVSGASLPCSIEMRVGRAADGSLVCTGLKLGGNEFPELDRLAEKRGLTLDRITARTLREIPLEQLMEKYAESYRFLLEKGSATVIRCQVGSRKRR